MQDDEDDKNHERTPSRLRRAAPARGVPLPPEYTGPFEMLGGELDEADMERAARLRNVDMAELIARFTRALRRLEEKSESRQRDEAAEVLLAVPNRVRELEKKFATVKRVAWALVGLLVSGVGYVAHELSSGGELRGKTAAEIGALTKDVDGIKQDIRDIRQGKP